MSPRQVRFATLCSGVEVPSLAFKNLGFQPVFFADNAAFPTRFLKTRFPEVPNLGDITAIDARPYQGAVDVLWASFPCQDFSEAGKRAGISGERGVLTLAGIRLVDEINPPVFCFENVKGLLSERKTNAFGQFLGRLSGGVDPLLPPGGRWTDAGYVSGPRRSIAWRVLDAQHFGLPQQRERVFVVACPVDSGIDPAEVLFETGPQSLALQERLRGGPAPLAGTPGCASAYGVAIRGRKHGEQIEERGPIANCLRTAGGGSDKAMALVWTGDTWRVRTLLPVECERLMGMPDGWTDIDGASDTDRWKAIGNSLAVPIVRWLGQRVAERLA